jgi:hypothetical protein
MRAKIIIDRKCEPHEHMLPCDAADYETSKRPRRRERSMGYSLP